MVDIVTENTHPTGGITNGNISENVVASTQDGNINSNHPFSLNPSDSLCMTL
ncbi:hypothetical protein HAX54_034836, partial [Datura stramonium]|nr:hypothetical protein [Datura stramonium]